MSPNDHGVALAMESHTPFMSFSVGDEILPYLTDTDSGDYGEDMVRIVSVEHAFYLRKIENGKKEQRYHKIVIETETIR